MTLQGPWSIRRRMLAIALGVAMLAWLVGGVVTTLAGRQADERRRDERLMQLAEAVITFTDHELSEIADDLRDGVLDSGVHVEPRGAFDPRYRYQIWRIDGAMLLRSVTAPGDRPLAGHHRPGFADAVIDGRPGRCFVQRSKSTTIEIQVAEVEDPSGGIAGWVGVGTLATMLLSMAGVALLAGGAVVSALRPVVAAEAQLRARQPFDLSPLPVAEAPQELQPILAALNQRLASASERLSYERAFTALAAHELRTPLAALRLQAQVALREVDESRRERQLGALVGSVDRCNHLLEQLLTLARLEQQDALAEPAELDLHELLEPVLDDVAADAARAGVTLQTVYDEPRLWGRPFAVQTLVRNLLSNAIAYSPSGAMVRLASRRDGSATVLSVEDGGPGLAAADRARVFERFVRLDRPGQPAGVGLGLSIVRSVADDHRASVELCESPLGGLAVRVSFPPGAGPGGNPAPAP